VVLVHGAFADGSDWRSVYQILTKDGYRVSVVQNPTASLADDVAGLRSVADFSIGASIRAAESRSRPNAIGRIRCAFAQFLQRHTHSFGSHLNHGGPADEAADASTGTKRRRQASQNRMESSVLQITPVERTALQMLADGLAHHEIASNLRICEYVLDVELITLFERMGVAGRNQ